MEKTQMKFMERLRKNPQEAVKETLCLVILDREPGEMQEDSRCVVLQLNVDGLPVYRTKLKRNEGERLEELRLWRYLVESLSEDWELTQEGKQCLLEAYFEF